ncbi:Hypoxanthine phosphoribosyltransferase [Xenorhabdus nematophila F1]|nr:Hypoxanthine phosphoribosyltransferase [Xenorhabdus nematophila F1]CEE93212.1 hypoxanthine phosphoribosyltransferase [Xenorhabdus nematophila str. Anatoliense]CEE93797.1 hypoxanthine phosphoribosyltransferase [Xenorhabdus nematophila str. Anatoliense]CEF29366.1 hypoxanthine phosphoribosyltransferase [Xenorhabdus nematophila str. Websteri]CEF31203.1 hypoxanthine phosphoribosyltransferase [Xenorhabdus nematophila str. Websteri]
MCNCLKLNQLVILMKKHSVEVMISEQEIKQRIAELGQQITEHYRNSDRELVLVGLLRGSFIFMADLCREVQVPHEVDFMTASSYGNEMSSTRDVKILKDLDEDIRGKNVLIVEDIIDSGNTLKKIREILELRGPNSLAICTLLNKPSRREVDVPVEWIGYSIEDKFVIGYGIDYAQHYRHLPYIGHVTLLED